MTLPGVHPCVWPRGHLRLAPDNSRSAQRLCGRRVVRALQTAGHVELHPHEGPGCGGAAPESGDAFPETAAGGTALHQEVGIFTDIILCF